MEELHTLSVDLAKRTLAVYGTDKLHYVKPLDKCGHFS